MSNEQQKDEIIVLESIFNNDFTHQEWNEQHSCQLQIFLPLPPDYYFTYGDLRKDHNDIKQVPIAHLPPVVLLVTLPNDYPSVSPPDFTILCPWLSYTSIKNLCHKLDQLWNDNRGQEILYTWAEFLQNETLEFLGIQHRLKMETAYTYYKIRVEENEKLNMGDSSANIPRGKTVNSSDCTSEDTKCLSPKSKTVSKNKFNDAIDRRVCVNRDPLLNPVFMLNDYNEKKIEIEYKKKFYTCKICFTDKSGESCTQFKPCLHVFCKECISEYFKAKIMDGAVKNIICPEDKCSSEALNGQIKDLVSPELFSKYDSTLLSATLATMVDIVHCPRRHCQYPVSKEPDEKMATCPLCNYAFCIYCKMVYHGVEPCRFSSVDKQELVKKYQNATTAEKAQLENRYGKKQLRELVDNTMSETWINANSRHCPQCNAAIEKSDGCNKMVCGRCNAFFCWICGTRLNRDNPYLHYQLPGTRCFDKLFFGVVEDDDDDLGHIYGGAGLDFEIYNFDDENDDDLWGAIGLHGWI